MTEAWIVGAVRTPGGRYGGQLAGVRPDDLAAVALAAVVERAGVPPADVGEVVLGAANQAGEDNRNVARMGALLAGFPETVPGVTVNRLCASGLEAVASAARRIMVGEVDVCIGGGVESMTRAPLVMGKAERPFARGDRAIYDTTLGWRFVNPRMEALYGADPMGETAEIVRERHGISRAAQDAFALASHRKAVGAIDDDRFAGEIVPVPRPRSDEPATVDEGPRAGLTMADLAALRPVFRADGTVTAGNSSSLSDGAAAVVLTSDSYARAHGLSPLARVRGAASAGVMPRMMGLGPVPAAHGLLRRQGLRWDDIDLIELNEAFAAQALAVLEEWRIDPEDPRLNVNGGAIALGHPLGCSGARLVTSMVHEMGRRADATLGLVTMCVGVGQGAALLLERPSG